MNALIIYFVLLILLMTGREAVQDIVSMTNPACTYTLLISKIANIPLSSATFFGLQVKLDNEIIDSFFQCIKDQTIAMIVVQGSHISNPPHMLSAGSKSTNSAGDDNVFVLWCLIDHQLRFYVRPDAPQVFFELLGGDVLHKWSLSRKKGLQRSDLARDAA